jgi:hypothetical protein
LFQFWFHSSFAALQGDVLKIPKTELDGADRDTKNKKFSSSLSVAVNFIVDDTYTCEHSHEPTSGVYNAGSSQGAAASAIVAAGAGAGAGAGAAAAGADAGAGAGATDAAATGAGGQGWPTQVSPGPSTVAASSTAGAGVSAGVVGSPSGRGGVLHRVLYSYTPPPTAVGHLTLSPGQVRGRHFSPSIQICLRCAVCMCVCAYVRVCTLGLGSVRAFNTHTHTLLHCTVGLRCT